MITELFKGTNSLTALLFRKDRWKILIWIGCIVGISLAAAAAYPSIYLTEEDVLGFAITMDNPAMKAMIGPGYELQDYNTATIFGHEMLIFTLIAIGVMNILIVGRSTRADEEDGILELVRSLPVGRLSYLSAAIIEGILLNLLLFLFCGIGLGLLNLDHMDWGECFLYGALLGGIGLFFLGLTATTSQLAETSRGATGFAISGLIVFYLLRAIGDVNVEVLSFLSPFGWASRSYVFAENHWWPVILTVVIGTGLVGFAFYLNSIRDMGAGFIPARPGRNHASKFLQTPIGFVLRQQRTNIVGWAIGLFVISASFSAIMGDLETYFSDMELLQMYFKSSEVSLSEQFMSLTITIISLFSLVPALMGVIRLKGEELKNRTEHFYSKAISRNSVMVSFFFGSLIAAVIMQLSIAFGFWSVMGYSGEGDFTFGEIFGVSLSFIPAFLVVIGLALLFIGLWPRLVNLVWLYFGYCFVVLYLGDLLEFPDWLNKISVFYNVPEPFIENINSFSLLIMIVIGTILSIIGFIGYNRRDISG